MELHAHIGALIARIDETIYAEPAPNLRRTCTKRFTLFSRQKIGANGDFG